MDGARAGVRKVNVACRALTNDCSKQDNPGLLPIIRATYAHERSEVSRVLWSQPVSITEEAALHDDFGNLWRHHKYPRLVAVLYALQDFSREDVQQTHIEIFELFDLSAFDDVMVKPIQM